MRPRVSVVMAVHNGEKYLREAIDSILGQTFGDFEFIVIDDGSTDRSGEIVGAYADPRISLVRNERNLGLTASLNRGLDLARGEYVARMDCDDVSLPERLAKQVAFMDANPEVGACGTWALEIDEAGRVVGKRENPVGERLDNFYWRQSLIHPAAMFRFSRSAGPRYDEGFRYAQDYDLWLRIRAKSRLSNLPEYLLLYRVHGESISSTRTSQQARAMFDSLRAHTGGLGLSYEEFLSLLSDSHELNPVRRVALARRLAKALRRPYRAFLTEDVRYAAAWFSSRVMKEWAAARARAYRVGGRVKRRLKHIL